MCREVWRQKWELSTKKDFDNIYKQSSYEIRQWIEGLSSDKWDAFAENKRGMSGSDYRTIWKVLNNEG